MPLAYQDYRDGIACVRRSDGLCVHIDRQGKLIHGKSFLEIDVFHKRFARAKDSRGWFHIRVDGSAAYDTRFAAIEAFYNGQAYCRDLAGRSLLINESGQAIHTVWDERQQSTSKNGRAIVVMGSMSKRSRSGK